MSGEDSEQPPLRPAEMPADRVRKDPGADTQPEGTKAKLDAKEFLARCEACGLDVQRTVAEDTYFLSVVTKPGQKQPVGMPLYAAICPNCGHVRFFHADVPE